MAKITKIKLKDGTIADIGGGTEVVANPTDEATEGLTKIKVGDTTYNISQGGDSDAKTYYSNEELSIDFTSEPVEGMNNTINAIFNDLSINLEEIAGIIGANFRIDICGKLTAMEQEMYIVNVFNALYGYGMTGQMYSGLMGYMEPSKLMVSACEITPGGGSSGSSGSSDGEEKLTYLRGGTLSDNVAFPNNNDPVDDTNYWGSVLGNHFDELFNGQYAGVEGYNYRFTILGVTQRFNSGIGQMVGILAEKVAGGYGKLYFCTADFTDSTSEIRLHGNRINKESPNKEFIWFNKPKIRLADKVEDNNLFFPDDSDGGVDVMITSPRNMNVKGIKQKTFGTNKGNARAICKIMRTMSIGGEIKSLNNIGLLLQAIFTNNNNKFTLQTIDKSSNKNDLFPSYQHGIQNCGDKVNVYNGGSVTLDNGVGDDDTKKSVWCSCFSASTWDKLSHDTKTYLYKKDDQYNKKLWYAKLAVKFVRYYSENEDGSWSGTMANSWLELILCLDNYYTTDGSYNLWVIVNPRRF